MQLHAIVGTEYRVLAEEVAILVRRRKHYDVVDLPADVVVEALRLIGCDPVLVSLVADDDRTGVGNYDFLVNMADPLPLGFVFAICTRSIIEVELDSHPIPGQIARNGQIGDAPSRGNLGFG